MFGASVRQLFEGILGIRQAEASCALKKVTLSPYLPKAMQHARGSLLTPQGRISVSLQRKKDKLDVQVTGPEGMAAEYEGKPLPCGQSCFIL